TPPPTQSSPPRILASTSVHTAFSSTDSQSL
ncbi:hypothetical protein A2U01_0112342, partial [Trifolium medium]|nr:hypothetical protein [Trifolium medium]